MSGVFSIAKLTLEELRATALKIELFKSGYVNQGEYVIFPV